MTGVCLHKVCGQGNRAWTKFASAVVWFEGDVSDT